jgi:hypothetical protein
MALALAGSLEAQVAPAPRDSASPATLDTLRVSGAHART